MGTGQKKITNSKFLFYRQQFAFILPQIAIYKIEFAKNIETSHLNKFAFFFFWS